MSRARPNTGVLLGTIATTLLAGCFLESEACTLDFRFGLVVTILDDLDGAPLAAGARGTAVDGSFVDSLMVLGPVDSSTRTRVAAGERAGTYTVTVVHPGYRDWQRPSVVVAADECHVIPVPLEARMVRGP